MYYNYDLIEYPKNPTIPKSASRTIHAAGELAGNPNDIRTTRSQFESALCVKDPLFAEKCYLMIDSDPQTYKDAKTDPIWKTSIKEDFISL